MSDLRIFLLVMAACLASLVHRPAIAMQSDPHSELVGVWQVTRVEHGGVEYPALAQTLQMVFSRSEVRLLQQSREPISVSYEIDVTQNPGRFSWSRVQNDYVREQRGRYSLSDDRLRICLAAVGFPAAKDFATIRGDGRTLFDLRRIDLASDAQPQTRSQPLGVFVLSSDDHSRVRRIVQLSIGTNGDIFGATYDPTTRQTTTFRGRVDSSSQSLSWNDQDATIFVPLDHLARGEGDVRVNHGDGFERWSLSHVFPPTFFQPPGRLQAESVE